MQYLDFDLQIEKEPDVPFYRAQVLNSPAGQASTSFSVPFSEQEIENLLLKIGRPRKGTRGIDSQQMEAAKSFGRRLFEAAFGGDVRSCLRSSLDHAENQDLGLRIRLRMNGAPELSDLPWEYLFNTVHQRFFSLSALTPIVRYVELPERVKPFQVELPLRVLVMVSSPPDYPALDVEEEWKKLSDALSELIEAGIVELTRLEYASLACLLRTIQKNPYHVFHFVGHGGFNSGIQDGQLILQDEKGRGVAINGSHLGTVLHDHRPLRLVVLNACDGARNGRTDLFSGAAQSLVQQGIPAVIAMQFEITDKAAIAFAHDFYSAVANGVAIDASLASARRAIFALGNDVEWGTPVLFMRTPDGQLFDIEKFDRSRKSGYSKH